MAKGDHIFTPRYWLGVFQIEHHGIDCGNGSVIHHDGDKICRVSYHEFRKGEQVHIRQYHSSEQLDPDFSIALAERCLSDDSYHLLYSNCEHFATWCKTGKWESQQVGNWFFGESQIIQGLYKKLQQEIRSHIETESRLNSIKRQRDEIEAQIRRSQIDAALQTDHADYRPLRDVLQQGDWQEADVLTRKLMLQAGGRTNANFFDAKDIPKFPKEHLLIIDELWKSHSKNKFGFSVQRKIYGTLGGEDSFCNDIYEKFLIKVGWNNPIQFNLQAPDGHLPFGNRNRWEIVEFFVHLTTDN